MLALGGMGAVGCTLPLGGAHPAVNAPWPSPQPGGLQRAEARQQVPKLAAAFSHASPGVPFPNGGRLGVMRGMAARRTWGKPKAALPRGDAGSSASSSAPLYRWETELEREERQSSLVCGSGVSGRLTFIVNV